MFHKVSQSKEKNFMVTKKVKFKKGSYNSGHKQQKNLNWVSITRFLINEFITDSVRLAYRSNKSRYM